MDFNENQLQNLYYDIRKLMDYYNNKFCFDHMIYDFKDKYSNKTWFDSCLLYFLSSNPQYKNFMNKITYK